MLIRGSDVERLTRQIHAHRKSGMTTETMRITPALAQYILSTHNAGNRSIRKSRVAELTKSIQDGAWRLTSQGISFSRDGLLNNGQHRLAACVEADKPILVRVTWGEEREVFDVLDTGSLRKAGDVLQASGHKDTNELGAAARLLKFLETSQDRIRNDEVVRIVSDNPSLAEVSNTACNIAKKFKTSSAGVIYAFSSISMKSANASMLSEFCRLLSEGAMLPRHSPILALREGLINKRLDFGLRHGLQRSEAIAACFIKAWNAWCTGADMKILRFNRNNERFPEPK
jgi:hypothetical protein